MDVDSWPQQDSDIVKAGLNPGLFVQAFYHHPAHMSRTLLTLLGSSLLRHPTHLGRPEGAERTKFVWGFVFFF